MNERILHSNSLLRRLRAWFDADALAEDDPRGDRIDWLRIAPFLALHVAMLAVFLVGFSWFAFWTAVATYLLRMFAITGFYHRYFSHKAFRTSRAVQFVFAFLAASSAQRGPLWWAAHHRKHHRLADRAGDPHSPRAGFWHSHVAWFLKRRAFATDLSAVPDLARFPELRWLDRYDVVAPTALAVFLFLLGEALAHAAPGLGTDGWQLLVWGFVVSTVVLFHATFTINSLAHRFGRRRFPTRDDSRNNFLLALITLGEGWHNNHHHYPGAARQGFRWWEIDPTYYLLRLFAALGLIWDLRPVPARLRGS